MPRSYSSDLRERVVRAIESGMSRRAAARMFDVSASSAVKWMRRYLATGGVAPQRMGAPRGSKLDAHEALLPRLIEERPDIILAAIQARLGATGVQAAIDTIWRFFERRRITFKKNRARQRTRAPGRGRGPRAVAPKAGQA